MAGVPQGIVMIGRYAGKQQVTSRDGVLVKNLWEVGVTIPGEEDDTLLRASYFDTVFGGRPSPMADALERLNPQTGTPVWVRVKVRGTTRAESEKAFVNYDALSIGLLPVADPVRAASNGAPVGAAK